MCYNKLSSGRVGIENCQEIHYVLRSLGSEEYTLTKHYSDNKSAIESCANENAE